MLNFAFFDDTLTDPREYAAYVFAYYFANFLTSGVRNGGTCLQVGVTGVGMGLAIQPGQALVNGYLMWIEGDPYTDASITLQTGNPTMARIDSINLRLDLTTRTIKPVVVQGTPASNPVAIDLLREADVYELRLATVRVPANCTLLTAEMVTDTRLDQAVCGIINSLVTLDTAALQAQWDAWFATIQGGTYALANHNHDGVYAKLGAAANFTTVTADIVTGVVFQ